MILQKTENYTFLAVVYENCMLNAKIQFQFHHPHTILTIFTTLTSHQHTAPTTTPPRQPTYHIPLSPPRTSKTQHHHHHTAFTQLTPQNTITTHTTLSTPHTIHPHHTHHTIPHHPHQTLKAPHHSPTPHTPHDTHLHHVQCTALGVYSLLVVSQCDRMTLRPCLNKGIRDREELDGLGRMSGSWPDMSSLFNNSDQQREQQETIPSPQSHPLSRLPHITMTMDIY